MRLHALARLADEPRPLTLDEVPEPDPGPGQVQIAVRCCGVCHTELDEIEGRTPPPELPVTPGHQIVGTVSALGDGVSGLRVGERVGVAWIHSACGTCRYCRRGLENLCADFVATGRDVDGGYAERAVVPADYAHPVPELLDDEATAPLLCAGAIGYRSLKLCELEDGDPLGLTGFGASGHLVLKLARHLLPESPILVFARDPEERAFARELGAVWAGESDAEPPTKLAAIIDTTPVWRPVVDALAHLEPAGRLVINAIRKQDEDRQVLSTIDYATHLWHERQLRSVANLTRADVRELLALAAEHGVAPAVQTFPLEEANRALGELAGGRIRGAKVLRIA